MRTRSRCHIDYEPVFTLFGIDCIPVLHCISEPRRRSRARRKTK